MSGVLTLSPAVIVGIHDGDTLHVAVPLERVWPDVPGATFDVRLLGVNAPELRTPEGKQALAAVQTYVGTKGATVTLVAHGREKYGRLLGEVVWADGQTLNAYVLTLAGSVQ